MMHSKILINLTAALGLLSGVVGHGNHQRSQASQQALNKNPKNSIPNPGGPTLPYNGTGAVPGYDHLSPLPVPITPFKHSKAGKNYLKELSSIVSNSSSNAGTSECDKCKSATQLLHDVAVSQSVQTFTSLIINYCELVDLEIFAVDCHAEFGLKPRNASAYSSDAAGIGAYWAQLYAKMDESTGDFDAWCSFSQDSCTLPSVIHIDESQFFDEKPASAMVAPKPSGKTIDVLHLSDWHLDPRYDIGSEANCSQYLCCRPYSSNTKLDTDGSNPSIPASRFGYLYCDSPPDLALSSFASMDKFFKKSDIAFTIFTGDIVSHDNDDQLSRAYVEYEERVTYETFKAQMGGSPIYPTLGNHDSLPEAFNTQNNIQKGTGHPGPNVFSWNYEMLSSMWQEDGWLSGQAADYASFHYGAYSTSTNKAGLRIISINTDFMYTDNIFNYWNFSNPDTSGMMKFLADELAACEKRGQRAWVIGHVLSGYDGSNALPNPSALFQSIIVRYSPATVAAVFFGHTHEDQLQIFYDYAASSLVNGKRNTTDLDYSKPLQMGFIGPSITPLTGNNAGYQVLQVDSKTFSIMGVQTYFANVSESLTWITPEWQFEYDARSTYNVGGINWPRSSPLNATFYDKVTDVMLKNTSLVSTYNFLETKKSVTTKSCGTSACAKQKVCYIRSGSAAVGQLCGSKNGPF